MAEISIAVNATDLVARARAGAPQRPGALERLGHAMQRHAGLIRGIQWAVVLFYLVLVSVPAFLPLPATGATMLTDLTLFAQFLFWGLWWPFVMVSMMLVGRVWCGVFCPEGALTEFASRHGLGRPIPRWMRWSGWPAVAFVLTTIYGQLISVYEYPQAALLILGGSTVAAVAVGLLYGRGKRVWCRYLCPASGVFALLAKLAPLHFRADEEAWRRQGGRPPRVDCGPLVNLRQLQSASQCHACGRCSGHRNAIALRARSPNREILAADTRAAGTPEALLLIFGLLGVAVGAFQWTVSPWFVAMKGGLAQWLVGRGWFLLLRDDAPWWLLTHYPAAGDLFTWLDGLCILAYIGAAASLLGGGTLLAVRLAGAVARFDWRQLAMGLVPLAGIGLFLGLSMMTLSQLRAEGIVFGWVATTRGLLLAGGAAWSAWLGLRLLARAAPTRPRMLGAWALYLLPVTGVGALWYRVFFIW